MNTLIIIISLTLIILLATACIMLWRKVKAQSEEVRQDEALQSLFENRNEAWIIFDAETLQALRANQKALNLFGVYRNRKLDQLSFKKIFREPLSDDEVQLLYSAIDQEAFINRKLQCSGINGRAFVALVSISRVFEGNLFCRFAEEPVRFELKQTPPLLNTAVNQPPATEPHAEKRSEPEIQSVEVAPEDHWKDVQDYPLVWITPGLQMMMVSDALARLTGYSKEELLLLRFSDLTHPSAENGNLLDDLTGGKVIYYTEDRTLLHKDGRKINVRCHGMMTRQPGIALLRLEDITEQKAVQKELLLTRDNLSAVVEHTTEAIFAVDALDKITVVNTVYRDRFFEKYGIWLKNGMNYGDALPKPERAAWRKTLNEVLRGQILTSREEFTNLEGVKEYYEVSLHPVYSGVHKLKTGASYFARNITKQIKYETELKEARAIAEKATEAKSRFLATMSHEIRTPLNGLIGMAELLRTTPLNDEQLKLLSKIRISGDALLQVVNEVLDYSKIEADKMHLESVPFRLEDVINETIDILSAKAMEKNLSLEKIIAPEVPAVIIGDKARLRQVLVNLAGNGVKFTDKGFVKIEVEKVAGRSNMLHFSISDSGIGMTPEQSSRLFREYEQAGKNIYGRYGGSGLGLTISKRIVELMEGTINFESVPGKGSSFYFDIPYKEGDPEMVQPAEEKISYTEKLSGRYPLNILVAEDNDVNQLLMVNILKQLGYKADAASDGVEVLNRIADKEYDLVFMDVQMPEMDGLEATRQIIKKYGSNRPFIVSMTGFASDEDRDHCLEAGMDDYISKPILIEDIYRMIKKWSDKRQKNDFQKGTLNSTNGIASLKDFTLLDSTAVQRLRDIAAKTDITFVNQVIALFERQVPMGIHELQEAAEAMDASKLWQIAHKLKGTCINVGAIRLAELFRLLEIKGKNGDIQRIDNYINGMQELFESTLSAFRKELSGEAI